MRVGPCRLCGSDAELQRSHVIPGFAFRWLRETSGTGHIRLGTAPNVRTQDGLKRYWLCAGCEGVLNGYETQFATRIFHPYSSGAATQLKYGRWLSRFCISVSWRVLRYYREETSLDNYPQKLLLHMDAAESAWKDVLLGRRPHPGHFRQHLLPVDAIDSSTLLNLPPNINRYLMRAIDMDLVRGSTNGFVYSKLGRFVILGFIKIDHPRQWVGTKVHATEGILGPRKYVLPYPFFEYLLAKARRMAKLNAQISKRQIAKIDQAFWHNIDRLAESDAMKAMEADVQMFGDAAFTRKGSGSDRGSR